MHYCSQVGENKRQLEGRNLRLINAEAYVRAIMIFQVDDTAASKSDGDADSESRAESELEEDSDTGPGSDSA
jgi:hypothetical protein